MADHLSCTDHKKQERADGFIGFYWGQEGKLFLDTEYCAVLGGGVWEGKM